MTRVFAAVAAMMMMSVAPALAIPPGGAVENPLGATVTVTTPTVAPGATVSFSATGYDAGESVSIKVDDGQIKDTNGNAVLATAVAGPDGTFTASVDLSRAAAAHADALKSGTHNVRLLSVAAAGSRSIHADFTIQGTGDGGGGGAADPGTGGGTPGTSTGTTPPVTVAPPAVVVAPRVASTTLRLVGGRVAVALRGGSAAAPGTASLRTRAGVTLARAVRVTLGAGATRTVRFTLTAAGKARLRRHRRLAVTVRWAPAGGTAVAKPLTLRPA